MTRNTSASNQTPVLNDALSLTEVQIWPVRNPQASRIKAMASITFNGALRITGCRIVEGSKGLFLAYPSEKKAGTDQFFPLFHPVDRTLGDRIQHEVLTRFQAQMA